jgi:CheY-like chemotaxis protein
MTVMTRRTSVASSPAIHPSAIAQEIAAMKLHVLIVDDSMGTRKMISRMLRIHRVCDDPMEARDGQVAVDVVTATLGSQQKTGGTTLEAPTERRPFDVILMDFVMPVMDGPTATKRIREAGYTGLIVGVTGNVLEDDKANFIAHGADAVLTKPLDMSALTSLIYESLKNNLLSEPAVCSSLGLAAELAPIPDQIIVPATAESTPAACSVLPVPSQQKVDFTAPSKDVFEVIHSIPSHYAEGDGSSSSEQKSGGSNNGSASGSKEDPSNRDKSSSNRRSRSDGNNSKEKSGSNQGSGSSKDKAGSSNGDHARKSPVAVMRENFIMLGNRARQVHGDFVAVAASTRGRPKRRATCRVCTCLQ